MENPLNECLCYKLQHLTRLLMVRLNDEIRPDGVTQGQLPVLCCLSDADGQTQAELCDKSRWSSRPWPTHCGAWNGMV